MIVLIHRAFVSRQRARVPKQLCPWRDTRAAAFSLRPKPSYFIRFICSRMRTNLTDTFLAVMPSIWPISS